MLTVTETTLKGVLLITPATNFEDFRGRYIETYNREMYHIAGITMDFVQDDISISRKHVLRGIHGDGKTWKLVSCLQGAFYLVVINNIPDSPEYRKWTAFNLSERECKQVLIPPGFGNGHVVMSDVAMFHYKQTSTYDRPSQFTLRWNDPELNLWWPVNNPILSQRDMFGE